MKCAVNKCKNHNNSKACNISFFSFPLNPVLLKKWILFCDRKRKFNAKTSHVCMDHFKPEDFENNLKFEMGFTKRRSLKHGVVPSIRKVSHINEELYEERASRIEKRENRKIVEMLLKEQDTEPVSDNDINNSTVQPMETVFLEEYQPEYEDLAECKTEIFYTNDVSEIEFLKKEREHLLKENYVLKEALKKQAAHLRALEDKDRRLKN